PDPSSRRRDLAREGGVSSPCPKLFKSVLLHGEVGKAALMAWRALLPGRSTPSEPRSREAARTCAGLDRRAATEAIMIAVICNLPSSRRDMTEARAIGQHPMHDDGEFACHRHLGFLHSASLGKLHPPALQCRAALQWLGQNDVGGLVKSCAYACI